MNNNMIVPTMTDASENCDIRQQSLRQFPYFDKFYRWLNPASLQSANLITYRSAIKCFLTWLDNNNIVFPTEDQMDDYVYFLLHEKKVKDSDNLIEPATAKLYFNTVRRFFRWGALKGYFPDVCEGIRGIDTRDKTPLKKQALSVQQVRNTLADVDFSTQAGLRDFAMILAATVCGLRVVELQEMNIEDIQMRKERWYFLLRGKGQRSKTNPVEMSTKVKSAIDAYLKTRPNAKGSDPLFVSHSNRSNGKRMNTKSIGAIIKNHISNACGGASKTLTAHSLRHTTATELINAGADLVTTQKRMRHSSPTTTMIYYDEAKRDNDRCAEALESIIFNNQEKAESLIREDKNVFDIGGTDEWKRRP